MHRNRLKTLLFVLMLAVMASITPAIAADPKPDPIVIATRLLDRLDADAYEAATADFTAQMKAALGADKLQAVQQQLAAAAGAVKSRDPAKVSQQSGMTVVVVRIHHAMASIDATISVDAEGKIAGLHFAPAPPPAAAAPAADAAYTERDLAVGSSGERALPGTLTLPKGAGPFPAVVLVHGSGAHDRDETIGPNRPFLDIARGLAAQGIAVLRYDKRTKARPQDFTGANITVDAETTNDAVAAITALRAVDGIDRKRLYVLGHSQGAMMAPRIVQRAGNVAGAILLAAPARQFLDIVIEQNRRQAAMDGAVSAQESVAIDKLVAQVARLRDGDVPAADTPMGLPAMYLRSIDSVDAIAEAQAIRQPLLLLQGGRDIQVVDADWQRWQAAFGNDSRATLRHYPALNHLGIAGEGPGTLAEYLTAGHVDAQLIADVAAWIRAH